jgi:hypothetical protein
VTGVILESEVPLEFQFQIKEVHRMPLLMTAFLRSMSILLFPLIKKIPFASNVSRVDVYLTGKGEGDNGV